MTSPAADRLQQVLAGLPASPGVYIMKDQAGTVLYVGKAKRLDHRVRPYFSTTPPENLKVRTLVSHVRDLEYISTPSEHEALLLELTLIKEHQPRYNINLKDDKRYPYVKVTLGEAYPRLLLTRKVKSDGARYFGPYTDVREIRGALKFLRTVFPVRSCVRMPKRACLDFHIHRCVAPCEQRVTQARYREIVDQLCLFLSGRSEALLGQLRERMELAATSRNYEQAALDRDLLQRVERLGLKQRMVSLDSRDQDVLGLAVNGDRAVGAVLEVREGRVLAKRTRELRGVRGQPMAEIWRAFVTQYYSRLEGLPREVIFPEDPRGEELLETFLRGRRADVRLRGATGEAIRALSASARQNAILALEESLHGGESVLRADPALYELQALLGLERPPLRIEGFDISHSQGSETVGSLVVLWNGRPRRSDYRHFRIRSHDTNDDFRSMHEVVGRRAARIASGEVPRPDLMLIDGGRGQLGAALEALREHSLEDLPAIGLAKKLEELHLPGNGTPLRLPRHSEPLKLLQRLRDEAHRFAVTYHRKLRTARSHTSKLRTLPGVGPGRERALLAHFGSLDAVRKAGSGEISGVGGIGPRLAAKIHAALHEGEEAGKQTA